MTKHGIPLNTLKECLQFLLWLNSRKDVQKQVADVLVNRYGNSYNHISFTGKLPADVSKFLEHVSTFYEKLVATPIKERYIDPQAKDVTEALLDCIPKFLAALYFLLYNVDYRFDAVGGGKWKYNYPGWEPTWSRHFWQKEYGGGLQDYLRVSLSDKYGDLIPGGFGPEEVTYGYDYGSRYGYPYGEDMTKDIEKMLGKNTDNNYFRDVFFTTVISKSGLQKSNTANVLALVKTFCEIVAAEEKKLNGEKFKTHLEKGMQNKRICWPNLVAHCSKLQSQLGKLFNEKAFSFTGQARTVDQLNTERFAGETAVWLRRNLRNVKQNVQQINKRFPVDNTRHLNYLQQFATKNIFPYGFIFGKDRYGTLGDAWKTLSDHWPGVIDMLGKNGGGLAELKRILDGGRCRPPAPPPKPRPRPAPAPRPSRTALPPGIPRTSGVRTTGPRNVGGWLSSGSQGSGARGGGGSNHRRGGPNRGGRSGAQRGRGQGPGPGGARGARGTQRSSSPGHTMSAQSPHLQSQDDLQSGPPPPPPPSAPGGLGHTGQSNGTVQGSPGGDGQGAQPGGSPVTSPTQPTSASDSQPGPTGGQGSGRHDSGVAGQDVGQASGKTPSSVATPSDAMAAGAGGGGRDPQSQVIDKKDSQNCPAGATEVTAVNSQGYICWPPPPSMKTPARIIPYDQRPSSLILKKLNDQESNALKEEEKEKHKQHAINVAFANSFNGSKITPPDPIEYYYGGLTGNVVRDDSGVIRQKSFLEKSLDASKQIFEESKSKLQALDNDRKRSMYFGGGGVDIRIPNKPLNVSFEITKPLDRNADKFPDPLLTALHDPEEFGLGGEEVYAEDYPLVSGIQDLRQKLYEKQKVEVEKLNRVLEEGEEKRKEAEAQYAFDQFKGKNDFLKDLWKVEDFRISGPPSPQTDEQKIDLRIDVPKPILQDPVHDFDFDEDSTHINDDALSNSVAPYKPAISLNVLPPKAKQLPPPTTDFDRSKINRQTLPMCIPDWSTKTPTHDATDIPETELFPSEAPRTVREMLVWMAGLRHPRHQETLKLCITNAFKRGDDDPSDLRLSILKLAAVFASSVLNSIAPKWRMAVPSVTSASKDPDCCALLCQLRDYVYACCHQLAFLKLQCSREQSQGGWQDCHYGRNVSSPNSPIQAFLTDASTSKFETHPFDPRNICRKSRVNMGFTKEDLPATHETGKHISTILSPTCGGEDPLLTLSSYLNCLTRRTPRTTGELVSFFHNFGNEMHSSSSQLSPLGSALSEPHGHCPKWDRLEDADFNAVKGVRGSATPSSIHSKDHPKTLSTLLGCGITNVQCPQLMTPITYRAYALYSPSFAHDYLSWVVYLPDRLWESLDRLSRDMKKHDSVKCASLHNCADALPLLYSHGFAPPYGTLQPSLTCSKVIAKLGEVVSGQPIASLMTAMDTFLYGIRMPFLFCLVTLWLTATVYILHSLLYRMDVLRIRSHLLTTRASHLIDVKALLAGSRRMLSLYKDVDYFDDDFHS
ncbi:Ribosome-binding protein 1 [Babesia ovata]|uniref:Ribosome-binding protein 1 n=1 Tax=Babesia ovata TaxID=189622 RepID=A0A2H6KFZ1_9APIC|nr:Ribosome-binding protein 1 [Babesia ovata]GBE61897.1 Ribosome-binding protein 1 [Babesia ovata]